MIVLCRCAYAEVLDPAAREQVLRGVAESCCAVTVVDDLCGRCARRDPLVKSLAEAPRGLVVACHERAVRWLLRFGGARLPDDKLAILDMRQRSAEEVVSAIAAFAAADAPSPVREDAGMGDSPPAGPAAGPPRSWVPWFPVIDYDRCTNCRQCMGFCLFGVYALDEAGTVRVASPSRCKTNCPACARTCPQVAIMFPKYPEGPISGLPVTPADLQRGDLRVPAARQRADIQAELRRRMAAGAAADQNDSTQRAQRTQS